MQEERPVRQPRHHSHQDHQRPRVDASTAHRRRGLHHGETMTAVVLRGPTPREDRDERLSRGLLANLQTTTGTLRSLKEVVGRLVVIVEVTRS